MLLTLSPVNVNMAVETSTRVLLQRALRQPNVPPAPSSPNSARPLIGLQPRLCTTYRALRAVRGCGVRARGRVGLAGRGAPRTRVRGEGGANLAASPRPQENGGLLQLETYSIPRDEK